MSASFEKSENYQAARDALPKGLHDVYRQLVEEYGFFTEVKYGRGYVAYAVLAELVKSGWRPSAEPLEGTAMTQE